MKNQNDFINEMDDGYIDIESCFDPVFEPPAELLEEWSRRYEGPEPTLENTSFMSLARTARSISTAGISASKSPSILRMEASRWTSWWRTPSATMRAGTAAPRPF